MRVAHMRTRGEKHQLGRLKGIFGVLLGAAFLVLLLGSAALAESSSTTSVSAGPSTTATSPATGVTPPVAGLEPLNPGWKTTQMVVQVWPEYDKEAVLVIMNFELPAVVPLPATFKFAVPAGAQIAGIGEIDPNGNFTFNYANSYPPVQSGTDWDVATIQVQKYRSLQIDYYYDPGLPAGAGQRSFPVLVQVPMDVAALNLHVQQPARATDFKVQPAMQGTGAAQDGFTYAVAALSDVKAGSTLGYLVSYSKPDGNLSTTPGQAPGATLNTTTVLLAVIVVIVVVLGGVIIYFLFRRGGKNAPATGQKQKQTQKPSQGQKQDRAQSQGQARPKVRQDRAGVRSGSKTPSEPDTGDADAARPKSTGYCPACGEELTTNARFCPSCGEAQDRK